MKNKLNPILALVICAVFWSCGGVLIKSIDWAPMAITGGRSAIACLFIILVLRQKPIFYITSNDNKKIDVKSTFNLWMGAICYSLTMILFVASTKMTTAANAVLLQYTNPIWIIIFSPFLLGEKNRKSDYLAVLGVLIGMFLFFAEDLEGGNLKGNILAAFSGITMGGMSIFMRRQKDFNPVCSFILSHILTFAIAFPFFFEPIKNGATGILCLIALGVIQMGIPSIMYSIGIKKESALTSMLISMLEPIMNPVWVMLIVHEKPSFSAIVGGLIILSTIIIRGYIQNKIPRKI